MIWVTWRQHRLELLGALLVCLIVIPFIVVGAFSLLDTAHAVPVSQFRDATAVFVQTTILWISMLPLIIGVFVGAPLLAREMEHGTYRLAWTQSISPSRWLAVKLGLLFGVTALIFTFIELLLLWWAQPIINELGPWPVFDIQGTVYVLYAFFALALGLLLGTLLRKIVVAMAATLVAFLAIRFALEKLRTFFWPAITSYTDPSTQRAPFVNDWILSQGYVDQQGHALSPGGLGTSGRIDLNHGVELAGCPLRASNYAQCLHDHGVSIATTYHPASQFWLFQGIESAIYLLLVILLLALTFYIVRYRTR